MREDAVIGHSVLTLQAERADTVVIGHNVLTLQAERADTAVMRHSVLTLQAVDSDVGVNAQLEYVLTDLNGHFNVNRTSGELSVAKALDYEDTRLFTVDVVVKDSGRGGQGLRSLTRLFTVDVVVKD